MVYLIGFVGNLTKWAIKKQNAALFHGRTMYHDNNIKLMTAQQYEQWEPSSIRDF